MQKLPFTLLILLLIGFVSCKRQTLGGLGGNANLNIKAEHHGLIIDSCTIYIKFNTQEAPSDGQYDLNQKVTTVSLNNSSTTFTGLKAGKYYLYAEGYDPSISAKVKGGIPYTIEEEKDYNIIIPVTETH